MSGSHPTIDHARLLTRLAQLATIGESGDGGVTRLAYSPEDQRARALVAGWMAEAGLDVVVDAAANLIGRRPGRVGGGEIVIGSHLDTVVDGGALDGAYGVVAAVEVADALRTAPGELDHDLAVVAFANEEGARGTPSFSGSLSVIGAPPPLDWACAGGRTLGALLSDAGGRPAEIESARWAAGSVAHYLELHIEQGPVLDAAQCPIGVVTGITGRCEVEIAVEGRANHAGTTPMEHRHDAAVAAARVVLAVRDLTVDGSIRVATVGELEIAPNVVNVVPASARIGVDLRDMSDARVAAATSRLVAEAEVVGAELDVGVSWSVRSTRPTVRADADALIVIEEAARSLGVGSIRLPSGAGHDAQVIAELAPVSLIFVPSVDGVSHSPAEHTDPDDLCTGADVLLQTLRRVDAALRHARLSEPPRS